VVPFLQFLFCKKKTIRKDERSWTSDTYAPYDDGHQWRKYGEKKLSNSNFPRFIYISSCLHPLAMQFEFVPPNDKFVYISVRVCMHLL
jgi:hypothetical protein